MGDEKLHISNFSVFGSPECLGNFLQQTYFSREHGILPPWYHCVIVEFTRLSSITATARHTTLAIGLFSVEVICQISFRSSAFISIGQWKFEVPQEEIGGSPKLSIGDARQVEPYSRLFICDTFACRFEANINYCYRRVYSSTF